MDFRRGKARLVSLEKAWRGVVYANMLGTHWRGAGT